MSLPILDRRQLLAGGAAVAATTLAGSRAIAQQPPEIVIQRARTEPLPIAIPDFASNGADRYARDIPGVIANNLKNSGLFRTLDRQAFISQVAPAQANDIRYADWKVIGAQLLVTGKVDALGGDRLRVEFRLFDVLAGTQIQGTAYTTQPANWRRIAHIISDVIYERALGEKGYFDTRIVYVAESGPLQRRTKRLAVMDQDGENHAFLTDGQWLALTPRFHPSTAQVAYMSFANNRPRVYLLNIDTRSQTVLGDFQGMTLGPRFHPDGNSVIMSATRAGDANIVSIDLRSRRERQLTSGGAIDVSPCYSPDGTQIVFNSDRGGDQQLYVMGADGGIRRISFGQGRYATPVWSPRGDLIAFTRIARGGFSIGVMKPDGSGERILSEGYQMEGPTFAPNGRVLMFFRESQQRDSRGGGYSSRLVSIDITGFNERVVQTPMDASDPAWSPLIP